MHNYDIEKIIEETIIDIIVEKVIEKIILREKKALIIFTGATLGFNQSIEALKKLKIDGWNFQIIISKSAENILPVNIIKKLSVKDLITEKSNVNIKSLVEDNNFIIVPSLTINTAAKVANCICDNMITNVIAGSIKSGKSIIACTDGCCPDNKERKSIGFYANCSYKDKMKNNLENLKNFGINFTISQNLAEKVNKELIKQFSFIRPEKNQIYDNDEFNLIYIKDRIINKGCIIENSKFSIIKVRSDSVVTKLAEEEAEKQNIKIVKE